MPQEHVPFVVERGGDLSAEASRSLADAIQGRCEFINVFGAADSFEAKFGLQQASDTPTDPHLTGPSSDSSSHTAHSLKG